MQADAGMAMFVIVVIEEKARASSIDLLIQIGLLIR
jgi:hypothetical protein